VARVIRVYARQKEHLQNIIRIRVTYRDPPAMATGFSVGQLPESSGFRPSGKNTDKVDKNSKESTSRTQRTPEGYPKCARNIPEGHPNNTSKGYPKDTKGIP